MAFNPEKYTWQGNTKKMYEYMVGAVPFIAQLGLKKLIGAWLDKRELIIVTEEILFECEKDLAPKAYQAKFKDTLESLRTV